MTSKYRYQVDIYRRVTLEDLHKILKDFENGTIVTFPPIPHEARLSIIINVIVAGYVTSDGQRVTKFTNTERREFIRKAKAIIEGLKEGNTPYLVIHANEYVSRLPQV